MLGTSHLGIDEVERLTGHLDDTVGHEKGLGGGVIEGDLAVGANVTERVVQVDLEVHICAYEAPVSALGQNSIAYTLSTSMQLLSRLPQLASTFDVSTKSHCWSTQATHHARCCFPKGTRIRYLTLPPLIKHNRQPSSHLSSRGTRLPSCRP